LAYPGSEETSPSRSVLFAQSNLLELSRPYLSQREVPPVGVH
jgi:hypothetical protein